MYIHLHALSIRVSVARPVIDGPPWLSQPFEELETSEPLRRLAAAANGGEGSRFIESLGDVGYRKG